MTRVREENPVGGNSFCHCNVHPRSVRHLRDSSDTSVRHLNNSTDTSVRHCELNIDSASDVRVCFCDKMRYGISEVSTPEHSRRDRSMKCVFSDNCRCGEASASNRVPFAIYDGKIDVTLT